MATPSALRIRRNIHGLGNPWADEVLWYARGVKALKGRTLQQSTSWLFYAAIHGINRPLWDFYQITKSTDPGPSQSDIDTYWAQCQHGSYYFLPWHRGYVLALENLIRHEIQLLGGPHQTWALPYWNYFKAGQSSVPTAFTSTNWPDGNDNPLFVKQRWGGPSVDVTQINLDAMGDAEFTGVASGGSPGFGGVDTGFSNSGPVHGGVETQPHDWIHGLVGGGSPTDTDGAGNPLPGLMSYPRSAALDPIFWLHHANLDRLWESWNFFPPGKPAPGPNDWKNPIDAKWLSGPASIGEHEFALPNPDGSKWIYTPKQMEDLTTLGYQYDDLTPGATTTTLVDRMNRLGVSNINLSGGVMASSSVVELVGANAGKVSLAGSAPVRVGVKTDAGARNRLSQSFSGLAAGTVPDRVFINLENVQGLVDSSAFSVYVGAPAAVAAASKEQYLAGGIALFGVSDASKPDGDHAGAGLTYVLEITKIIDRMHLDSNFNLDELPVELIPVGNIPPSAKLTIGRISIYRQGK